MSKQYLIRQSHYSYDDESYFPIAKSLHRLYKSKEEAQKKAKELNIVFKMRMPADFGNMKAYTVVKVEQKPQFYMLWNPAERRPLLDGCDGEWGEFVIYGFTEDEAHRLAFKHGLHTSTIEGAISEISSSPKILKSFIESEEGISYKNNVLRLTQKHMRRLVPPLNELLKKPFYQIKTKSYTQLAALEREYNSTGL